MKRSKSSRRWLQEHFSDPYVKQAQQEGFRSRATFKLLELQTKDRLFKPGMNVVDLGAAPGGWSQLMSDWVGPQGRVIALDILEMPALPHVEFIQGDFSDDEVLKKIEAKIAGAKIDWVISDMAPNMSGIESVDIPRAMYLCELALDFALKVLDQDQGGFLVKTFQGAGFEEFLKLLRQHFKKVVIRKPKASRDRSREIYLVAMGRLEK